MLSVARVHGRLMSELIAVASRLPNCDVRGERELLPVESAIVLTSLGAIPEYCLSLPLCVMVELGGL